MGRIHVLSSLPERFELPVQDVVGTCPLSAVCAWDSAGGRSGSLEFEGFTLHIAMPISIIVPRVSDVTLGNPFLPFFTSSARFTSPEHVLPAGQVFAATNSRKQVLPDRSDWGAQSPPTPNRVLPPILSFTSGSWIISIRAKKLWQSYGQKLST